jgi:hypothetical protein
MWLSRVLISQPGDIGGRVAQAFAPHLLRMLPHKGVVPEGAPACATAYHIGQPGHLGVEQRKKETCVVDSAAVRGVQ